MIEATINFVNGFILGGLIGLVIGLALWLCGIIPFGTTYDVNIQILMCICVCGGLFGYVNTTDKEYSC